MRRDYAERRQWDELMAAHHYVPYNGSFWQGCSTYCLSGRRIAGTGWQAGAFKLSVRDWWIGWSSKLQHARLHLIANNARIVILSEYQARNLASRVMSLCLKRLSVDMLQENGYSVYLTESLWIEGISREPVIGLRISFQWV